MHEDRDHFLILITLVPLVIFVGLYVTWQAAGQPALMMPDVPFPSIALPTAPDLQQYVPSWMQLWWNSLVRNGGTVFPAIAIGLFVGVIGVGTVIDICKVMWKRISPRFQPAPEPTAKEISDAEIA